MRKKKILILVILLAFLISGIIWFVMANHIDKVTVKGCEFYSEEEIKEKVVTGVFSKNSIFFYLKGRYFGFEEIPYIEKITVKRINGHHIQLRVYEKPLVACVKYMNQYIYFDKNGIVLETSNKKREEIPCITGLTFSEFRMYEPMIVEEKEIFDTILVLSQIINRYQLKIDKIHFNTKQEVTLVADNIRILLGKRDFYDEPLAALSDILPKALEQKMSGTLDMENYSSGSRVIFRKQ